MELFAQEPERLRTLGLVLMGALLAAGICLWLSNLTGGPEYGGRWDVPPVNYVTWFGFLACMASAVLAAAGMVLRALGMGWDRIRDRGDRPPTVRADSADM